MTASPQKLAWDKRVRELNRKRLPDLQTVYTERMREAGRRNVYGGPTRRTEYIADILSLEFPDGVK